MIIKAGQRWKYCQELIVEVIEDKITNNYMPKGVVVQSLDSSYKIGYITSWSIPINGWIYLEGQDKSND